MSLKYLVAAASLAALLSAGSSAKALETEFIFTGTVSDFVDATGNTFGENGADLDGAAYVSTFYINTDLGHLVSASTLNPQNTGQVVLGGAEYYDASPVYASLEINGVTQNFVAGSGASDGGLAGIVDGGASGYAAVAIVGAGAVDLVDGAEGVNPLSPPDLGLAFSEQNLTSDAGSFALPTASGDLTATIGMSPGIVNFTSAAPEPSTWLLMIVGVGVAGGCLRRRGKASHLPLLTAASG
jgi:hypothetical protein